MANKKSKWKKQHADILNANTSDTSSIVPTSNFSLPIKYTIADRARQVAVSHWVEAAVNNNLLPAEDALGVYSNLMEQTNNWSTSRTSSQAKYWYQHKKAQADRAAQVTERYRELENLTRNPLNPANYIASFNPNNKHSYKNVVSFDTEFTDSNQVIQLSGVGAVLAKTPQGKYRFELVPDTAQQSYDRFYIPSNLEKDIVKTGNIHNMDRKGLQIMRNGAGYSESFNKSELAAFEGNYSGYAKIGYNIWGADLPVMYNKDAYGFGLKAAREYNQTVLDFMDLSRALFGEEAFYKGKLGLQKLAERYGVSAKDLGIQAHGALADSIVMLKTAEGLFNEFPEHPAVKEFIAALNDTVPVHSHKWENVNPTDLGKTGFVTTPFKGSLRGAATDYISNAVNGGIEFAVAIKDILINGFGLGEGDYSQALESNANIPEMFLDDPRNPKEITMEDVESMQVFADEIKELKTLIGSGSGVSGAPLAAAGLRDMRKAIKAALLEEGFKTGEGWDDPSTLLDNVLTNEHIQRATTEAFRTFGYGSIDPKDFARRTSPAYRNVSAAMAMIRSDYMKDQQSLAEKQADLLYKNSAYSGNPSYDTFADINPNDVGKKDINEFEDFVKEQRALSAEEAEHEALVEEAFHGTPEQRTAFWDRARTDLLQAKIDRRKEQGDLKKKKLNKLNELKETGYMTGSQYAEAYANLDKFNVEFETFTKNLEKSLKPLKTAERVLGAIGHSYGGSFYNFANLTQAHITGIGQVGDAVNSLLPGFAQRPAERFTKAMQQDLMQLAAMQNKNYKIGTGIGGTLANIGTSMLALAPHPYLKIAGAALGAVGMGVNLGSNIVGESKRAEIETFYEEWAKKINLFSAGLNAVLAPLHLLRNGLNTFLNLWARLGKIWGSQFGIPYRNLTNIRSSNYAAMLQSDTFFGLKQGSLNAMHNQLALDQAGLYSSGRYNEAKLVAAARLGVFDSVFAPMGGDTASQMADTVDSLMSQMRGASKADKQQLLYLAKDIDPNLPEILERMDLYSTQLGKNFSFRDYQSGRAFSNVRQWNFGDKENAKWEWTAGEYNASQMQLQFGLKRIATPLWDSYGLPFMNLVNSTLNALPQAFAQPGNIIDKLKPVAESFWTELLDIFGFKSSGSIGGDLQNLWDKGMTKLHDMLTGNDILANTLYNIVYKAFVEIGKHESELINALAPIFQGVKDYIEAINFKIHPENLISGNGSLMTFELPSESLAKRTIAAKNAYDKTYGENELVINRNGWLNETFNEWKHGTEFPTVFANGQFRLKGNGKTSVAEAWKASNYLSELLSYDIKQEAGRSGSLVNQFIQEGLLEAINSTDRTTAEFVKNAQKVVSMPGDVMGTMAPQNGKVEHVTRAVIEVTSNSPGITASVKDVSEEVKTLGPQDLWANPDSLHWDKDFVPGRRR